MRVSLSLGARCVSMGFWFFRLGRDASSYPTSSPSWISRSERRGAVSPAGPRRRKDGGSANRIVFPAASLGTPMAQLTCDPAELLADREPVDFR